MKKFIAPLVIGVGLLLLPSVTIAKETQVLKVNGEEVSSKAKPYKDSVYLFVPFETIAKKMGDTVTIKNATTRRQANVVKKDGTTISVADKSPMATVNKRGIPFKYEEYNGVIHDDYVNSFVRNNQVYVTLDFVADKKGMNYPVKQIRNKDTLITYVGSIPTIEKLTLNKKGHTTVKRTVYASRSEKAKSLGTLKKNETFQIDTLHKGYYKIKYGKKTGYITPTNVKEWGYVKPGKKYKDGWVAPVLKSEWSSYHEDNGKTLMNELGFRNYGTVFNIEGQYGAIQVFQSTLKEDVTIRFSMWGGDANGQMKQAYRIPIVAKEVFKLYFGKDATRVWNYLDRGDIPEKFTANGKNVKANVDKNGGTLLLKVGKPGKKL